MSKKLTILFAPFEGVGHVNACIGLAEQLLSRGHKIVFAVDQSYKGKLVSYGFEEEILINTNPDIKEEESGEDIAKHVSNSGILSGISPLEQLEIVFKMDLFNECLDRAKANEPILKEIVDKHKPDVYIVDNFIGSPTLLYSDKPWVLSFSGNPLYIDDERTPPTFSGYPSNGDKSEWKTFREVKHKLLSNPNVLKNKYNEWMTELGFPTTTNSEPIPYSPYLNLYQYPQELDYTDIRPMPDKWFRIDSFMRKPEKEFEIPEKLRQRNGKLIYLSLGSMGSIDIELMKRLVKILSKSENNFIVSKGLLGDKYELADNMWGQKSVPQINVIPLVDLVITHGGNNSVTEIFSFGKPMIVMPLFSDQFDNAQRVQEREFGVRLDPYNCADEELLNSIESLLNDNQLRDRLAVISKRILSSNSIEKASEMIEKLVK